MTVAAYTSVLNQVQAVIQNLTLTGLPPQNVLIRMLPKAEEEVDPLPQVAIVPSEKPEIIADAGFENQVDVTYEVQVVIIAANNHDFATNLPTYLLWREQVRRAFQPQKLLGISTIWSVDLDMEPPLDREMLNKQYAYSGMGIKFVNREVRQ